MNKVTIFRNAVEPSDHDTTETEDVCAFLAERFGTFPDTAKIYHDRVAVANDVTPHTEAEIEHLQTLTGHFFVVIWPEDPITIGVIVAIAVAAVSIGLSFLLRPSTPNANDDSPNNELGSRQNKARPTQRIPDIVGTVRSTPDLLALPYKIFVENQEFEVCYMCIGRGSYTIIECDDDQTPVSEIAGEWAGVYPPFTSPNSVTGPSVQFGFPPATIPKVVTIQQSNAVNGQVIRASNSGSVETNNNVSFGYGGTVNSNDSSLDFTDYFIPSTQTSPAYMQIFTNDDGLNASDPAENVHSVGLAGVYQILSVTPSQIVLSNPAAVNSNWNVLATFAGQASTFYHTFQMTTAGTSLVDGPYILDVANLTEVWANFVAMQGLYYIDPSGTQHALTVTIQMSVQAVDAAYVPFGDIISGTVNIVGSGIDNTQCGSTLKLVLPVIGPVQVTVTRITPHYVYHSNKTMVDQIQWRDLYAVSPGMSQVATVQGTSVPWNQSLPGNAAYPFANGAQGDVAGTAPAIIPCTPGQTLNLAVTGYTTAGALAAGWTYFDGAGGPYSGNSSTGGTYDLVFPTDPLYGTFPAKYISGATSAGPITLMGLIGAFTDAIGNVLKVVAIGNGASVTAPAGAVQLQIGVNDIKYSDNIGSYVVSTADFGDVTTVLAITAQTQNALSIKERKLNLLVTRNLPTWINRTAAGAPQFSTALSPTNNAADILCALALDPYVGRRQVSELDVAGIYGVADSAYLKGEHINGTVATYFGTFLMTEFCYTFDDAKMSFEESAAYIAQAINSIAYRSASTISLSFEQQTTNSTILYNHRNKIPKSETRTVSFGMLNDNDSVQYQYVDPNAPNYPDVDTALTLYYPTNQSGINPKKVQSIGVRNIVQATINGWRLFQKIINASVQTEFEATQEATLSIMNDRILVADNTRAGTQDGELIAQSGLTVTTSQPVTLTAGLSYTVFLQLSDGTIQSIGVTAGAGSNTLVLAAAPALPLVTDPTNFARTTYVLVGSTADKNKLPFLLTAKDPQDNNTFKLTAINYSDAYYVHDKDFISGTLLAPPDGYAPQGYTGSGLTGPDGNPYTPTPGDPLSSSGYNGSGVQTQNNPQPPVTTTPTPPTTEIEGSNVAENETLTPVPDGTNTIFKSLKPPSPATSAKLYEDGVRQNNPNDFSVSNNVFTFTSAPVANAVLTVDYSY